MMTAIDSNFLRISPSLFVVELKATKVGEHFLLQSIGKLINLLTLKVLLNGYSLKTANFLQRLWSCRSYVIPLVATPSKVDVIAITQRL